jgi:DNA repair protein RecN (Recombination protein N)
VIKTIYVKDFALIDELEIHPGAGLNIITGQTGAGKSILVGALNMILGERADTEVIRSGATKAIAEAIIALPSKNPVLEALLKEAEVEVGAELILRREIRDSGSRAFINDTPVAISVLKAVGDQLVDLHGQHDHQLLLREENHQLVLDVDAEVVASLNEYRTQFDLYTSLDRELKSLRRQEQQLREKQELFRFQVKELEQARLDPDEIEEMENEMRLLDNAEILDQKAALISSVGGDGELDITTVLTTLEHALEDLARIEPEFGSYLQEFEAARITVQETIQFAERYRSTIEFNPNRLEFLRNRQSDIKKLEKKYGKTVTELLEYLDDVRAKLNLADNFEIEIEKLVQKLGSARKTLTQAALNLHNARIAAGTQLSASIIAELAHLGIPHAAFRVDVSWISDKNGWIQIEGENIGCTESGADTIRFFISTNKGESPKPLSKTASGGEISRVMLALKSILAREQSLPVMIFDEIDTGISGEVAEKVGRTMRRLSSTCQIIAITHQPQIASQAHHHFKVAKIESADRTTTSITKLNDADHILEVATLMSGATVTSAAIESAKQLIQEAASQRL